MARNTSNFLIGLFVTSGVVIIVFAVVWLSASKYFEKGYYFVTYFDESVQGLQIDSAVKYRGIAIGNVERIAVAPDRRLIEVVMRITVQPREEAERRVVATLKSAGITGIVFVEIDQKDQDEPDLSPKLSFEPEFKVVPSQPSDIKQLLDAAEKIVGKIEKIVDEVEAIDFGVIAANIESVTVRVNTLVKQIQDAPVKEVLVEARETLVGTQGLIKHLNNVLDEMNLAAVSDKAQEFIGGLDRNTRAISINMRASSENLKRATGALELLLEKIEATPSDIIFSSPPPLRRDE
jgi:phospholipid/cholesterol/gamma-HCH transport system substrate-binding protein